ncbi:hypothetical protein OS493_031682 [Desmophyllum pertusum]|uniref:Uncharacterized protein n=1 Tax=Desmophyllum pertusum TaxID=174260 RepID=A0A9W9ZYK4_9CNID|nr:hypothetical protein OS493_031682 [Desmophyllum pertusum]
MMCAAKAQCGNIRAAACNSSTYQGMGLILKKCELKCCDNADKCNGIGAAGATMPANHPDTAPGNNTTLRPGTNNTLRPGTNTTAKPGPSTTLRPRTSITSTTLGNNGCSHVASFVAILMSITAIFAGFFTH